MNLAEKLKFSDLLPAHPASFAHNICLWDAKFLFQQVPGCNSIADLSLKLVFWTHKFSSWDSLIRGTASPRTHKPKIVNETLKSNEKIHKFHYLICSGQIIIWFAKTYIVSNYLFLINYTKCHIIIILWNDFQDMIHLSSEKYKSRAATFTKFVKR